MNAFYGRLFHGDLHAEYPRDMKEIEPTRPIFASTAPRF
jgi:hypothetical protein